MNTVLNFMEKFYSDVTTLYIVYIVGAVLLLIFIIMLIVSLRSSSNKVEVKKETIEENKNDIDINKEAIEDKKDVDTNIEVNEDKTVVEEKEEIDNQNIFEKTTVIPLNEIKPEDLSLNKEETIEKALDNASNMEYKEPTNEESKESMVAEIPDVDDFVNDVIKKTYEKTEQFSSVYVDNENKNDDSNNENMPLGETVEDSNNNEVSENKDDNYVIDDNSKKEDPKEQNSIINLNDLKNALNEEKTDVSIKQDDLKQKLDSIKKTSTKTSAEELLKKLNS